MSKHKNAAATMPASTFTSTERDIRLIQAVRGYEVLFDPRCLGYKDPRVKESTWKIVAAQIAASPDDCRNRWRSLRDRFVREKKAMLLGQKRDEEGVSSNRRLKPWRLIEPMTFLWDFIMHRSRRGVHGDGTWTTALTDDQLVKLEAGSDDGLVCEEDEEENGDASFEWITVSRDGEDLEATQRGGKRHREEAAAANSPGMPVVVTSASCLAEVTEEEEEQDVEPEEQQTRGSKRSRLEAAAGREDEDSLFCKSVAHTLRRLPPRRKALAKLRVLQALYDAEFGTDVGPDVEVRLRPADLL